jgi:hypothetical protein
VDIVANIGDVFVIDHKGIRQNYSASPICNFPNKKFIITHFSKSGMSAYYVDNRTSNKCKCYQCQGSSYSEGVKGDVESKEKCISVYS